MAELETTEGAMPSTIGPYRLARRLGRGGMGEVFLAWDERLGRRVAVKRILRDNPRVQDRERLRREARAAARLSHPAVVQVYDLVEDSAGDAIVLEYVEGRTLRALLAEGVPPLALAVRLAREIAEGLSAAHAAGLVHRDLKPENVVVTREGHAKILDFGIAKIQESEALTAHGVVVGTAHAMSPEQARGGEVDGRSDLFSLGILLYELLAGTSPFRGKNSLDELQKVIGLAPTPVGSLRPDVPRDLANLVDRLLSKRPEARPRDAGEVARTLSSLSDRLTPTPDAPAVEAGNESTLCEVPAGFLAPRGGGLPTSTATATRRLPQALLTVLLAAFVLSFGWLLRRQLGDAAPKKELLRVAVLAPKVEAGGPEAGLIASGLLTATLSALASLEGVAPLDPAQASSAATPTEAMRTAAAREAVALGLERQGEGVRASLRRVAEDSRVLWTTSFPVPAGSGDRDLRLLADAVAVQIRKAYADHRPRPGLPELEVSDRDYAELLRVKERVDRGSTDPGVEMAKVEAVVGSSPRFLEGHLLLADLAHSRFSTKRDPTDLERGLRAAATAAELAPGDPRPLVARFRLDLFAEKFQDAEAVMASLASIVPGDPQLHALAGQLAESRGDLGGAAAELTEAVKSTPSWSNLYRLASLEMRLGRTAAARQHLEQLLARSPGNLWGLGALASLELLQGDPARAETLYSDLIRRQPQSSHFTNLGLARSLQGQQEGALAAYRQALEANPDNPYLLLNLADAELALGHEEEARRLYGQTLESLGRREAEASQTPLQLMVRAQCLAHLGRQREAAGMTQRALKEGGEDPEILYAASLVYAVIGDRSSALYNAESALKKGTQPRWFTLPAFGPLRDDPDLKALIFSRGRVAATPGAR